MRLTWLLALALSVPFVLASPSGSAAPHLTILTGGGGDDKPPPKDGACLRSCFNDKPECPKGMEALKLSGNCWTCCLRKDPDKDKDPNKDKDNEMDMDMDKARAKTETDEHPANQPGCRKLGEYCCTAQNCAWCCNPPDLVSRPFCGVNWPWEWEGYCRGPGFDASDDL
ncbi:hypothetical protein BDW74DRAFT_173963 [Aspergillus multicolor]|uniref:uncharacterized protein n=1 Tax=Aspergillus multicolor TaxID=41759 RepID=UPI003CCD98C6